MQRECNKNKKRRQGLKHRGRQDTALNNVEDHHMGSHLPKIVAMVHVPALPGTPGAELDVDEIIEHTTGEALQLAKAGVDAVLIENMHDTPYLKRTVGPEIVAMMAAIGTKIRSAISQPLGVQILAGANQQALAVAHACGAQFIRAEGFVFAHTADEGIMQSDAGELLRYRRAIGAETITVWCDIKKKHSSHSLTADIDVAETAKAAAFFGANAVIVTGSSTGHAAALADIKEARTAGLPVVVGSGTTADNLGTFWSEADAFIVGSSLKVDGLWSNPIEQKRLDNFVHAAAELQQQRV